MATRHTHPRAPHLVGTLLALGAALLFGASTPAVQQLGRGLGQFSTAALLYAGVSLSGLALLALDRLGPRTPDAPRGEAPLRLGQAPRLVAVALAGAVIAPAALAWGLQRSSGVAASLLVNLEAVFTVVLGALVHREHVGRRVAAAAALMTAGGALVVLGGETRGAAELAGLAAVTLATVAWAVDNTLARPLADLDPSAVVAAKGALGAGLSLALGLVTREPSIASPKSAAALALVGMAGWGLSLRLYMLAQRRIGAGRTASVFAFAPFAGAAGAMLVGQPIGGAWTWAGGGLLAVGVALHLTEHHEHEHAHDAVEHEHAHRHDDGHHDHHHDPVPDREHSHPHRHEAVRHEHAHAPDQHHQHVHEGS
jgi:drug/metabolite transporter (DMT)-like permease